MRLQHTVYRLLQSQNISNPQSHQEEDIEVMILEIDGSAALARLAKHMVYSERSTTVAI